MPALDLPRLAVGARVQHELLIAERSEKKTTAGDPFIVLTLMNSTGRIESAPIWSDKLEWADGADAGRVVQVIGDVTEWGKAGQRKKQLALTAPVRLIPPESVSLDDFLPRISDDPQKYWTWIDKARGEMKSPALRRVVDLFYGDDAFRVRFERWPASVAAHHALIGGLLQHVTEVAVFARTIARSMHGDADLALAGALLHDIGKLEAYEIGPRGFAYTPANVLVGHVVLGLQMLNERLATLPAGLLLPSQVREMQHLVLAHHGSLEFGSPVIPATLEAEIVHWADEASAKANDMGDTIADPTAFDDAEQVSRRMWRVGRRVWKRPHDWA